MNKPYYTAGEILLKNKTSKGEFLFNLIHIEVTKKLDAQKKSGKVFISDEDIDLIIAEVFSEDVVDMEYVEIPSLRVRISDQITEYLSVCEDIKLFTHTDLINLIQGYLK